VTNLSWKNIWNRKSSCDETDKLLINGWEQTNVDMQFVSSRIKNIISLKKTDSVLEVGCGSGALSQYFIDECNYFGCDYSSCMVEKYKQLTSPDCVVSEANKLTFEDNSFDKVIVFSSFQYFPSYQYADECIAELFRVSKQSVFLGDLAYESHDDSHLLFTPDKFSDWEVSAGFVEGRPRFNVYVEMDK